MSPREFQDNYSLKSVLSSSPSPVLCLPPFSCVQHAHCVQAMHNSGELVEAITSLSLHPCNLLFLKIQRNLIRVKVSSNQLYLTFKKMGENQQQFLVHQQIKSLSTSHDLTSRGFQTVFLSLYCYTRYLPEQNKNVWNGCEFNEIAGARSLQSSYESSKYIKMPQWVGTRNDSIVSTHFSFWK